MSEMFEKLGHTYKPLPDCVTIKPSLIHGLGLFKSSLCDIIQKNTMVGITHISHKDFENGLIRTPLGGFINHSEYPNANIVKVNNYYYLLITENIEDGEITVNYSKTPCLNKKVTNGCK